MINNNILNHAAEMLTGFEKEFFLRMWTSNTDKYIERIKMIGFTQADTVLDAGFGNGQWLVELSKLNKQVYGIEYSDSKLNAVKYITDELKLNNLDLRQGDITQLPYADASFDSIFCYGVIYLTDYKKALHEFYRVLKPGGKLYFTFTGLGWFLMCLITEHNKSPFYDPRQMAADTIRHTLEHHVLNKPHSGEQFYTTRDIIQSELTGIGFKNININYEGHINLIDGHPKSFYNQTKYLEQDFIYEILCEK